MCRLHEPGNQAVEEARALILASSLGVWLIGFHIAMALFPLLYVRTYGGTWRSGLILSTLALAFVIVIFDQLLEVFWPTPFLFDLFGLDYFA